MISLESQGDAGNCDKLARRRHKDMHCSVGPPVRRALELAVLAGSQLEIDDGSIEASGVSVPEEALAVTPYNNWLLSSPEGHS